MSWKGFYKESVLYIRPKGLINWIKFLTRLPVAYYKFLLQIIKN